MMNSCPKKNKAIVLFDVDGTLTANRGLITDDMLNFMKRIRDQGSLTGDVNDRVDIGIVGGSDIAKQKEQLGPETFKIGNYNFAENGVVAYKDGELFHATSFKDFIGEEKMQKLLNFILKLLAEVEIPIKRGTFVEYRLGMLNISPIGRNCSLEERNDFEKYDLEHKIREKMVKELETKFPDFGLKYSIGGQISFDIFPIGWDKTYCLRFLEDYDTVHFFGDRTFPGGNDYEIFSHPRVIGHSVSNPSDTMKQVGELLHVSTMGEEDMEK